jgi:hypothetical protein
VYTAHGASPGSVPASPVAERRSEKATAPLPGELLAELLGLVGDINRVLDPDALLPAIARNLRRIVDYRVLDIFLPEAEGHLSPAYGEGYDRELAMPCRTPVHYQAASRRAVPIEVSGLPLGTFDGVTYDELSVRLGTGDLVVLGQSPADDVTLVVVKVL